MTDCSQCYKGSALSVWERVMEGPGIGGGSAESGDSLGVLSGGSFPVIRGECLSSQISCVLIALVR